jgi:hypothetical protein
MSFLTSGNGRSCTAKAVLYSVQQAPENNLKQVTAPKVKKFYMKILNRDISVSKTYFYSALSIFLFSRSTWGNPNIPGVNTR